MGLSLNLREIDWGSPFIWIFSSSVLVFAVLGKVLAGIVIAGEALSTRLTIGIAMVPRGEVGLVFAELGYQTGIFSNEVHAGMVIVIALSTIIPPFVLKWYYQRYPSVREEHCVDGSGR